MPEIAPKSESASSWRDDLRVGVLVIAISPVLVAVGLLAGYYVHREMEAAWSTLENRGVAITQRLAEAAAFDLFAGNAAYLRRLLDYELQSQDGVAIGITDQTGAWWLTSGAAEQLPQAVEVRGTRHWWERNRFYFVHPIHLRNPIQDDPYLAGAAVPSARQPIGQVAVVLSTDPVDMARRRTLLIALGATIVPLSVAGWLAWRLSQRLSRPLHAVIAAVRSIAGGRLAARVHEASRGEIGDLQRGINHMAAVMQANAQEMEQRVETATAELRAQKQAAEEAVLARSRFLVAASHDLRQPMHALILLVEALQQKLADQDGEARRLVEHVSASAHSMRSLLDALLDLSRLDAGTVVARPGCVSVRPVLLRLSKQYAPLAAEKGLTLRVRSTGMALFTDPLLLERILGNLTANAIRYTSRGGIVIGVRRVQKDWARVEVWDSGQGIPEEYRERIFEEYFQLENPERDRDKGLGLGLAIVKRLARLLGSPVEVRSVPGRGSVFSIRAMRCELTGVTVDDETAETERLTGANDARPLVVFVDDNEAILEAMALLFDQWGIDLAVGSDATQIRAELREIGRVPQAILSDYRLREGRTGVDAVRELRAAFGPDLPAALITGETAPATMQAVAVSGLPVLYKPLKPPNLRAFVHHLLGEAATRVVDEAAVGDGR